MQGKEVHLFPVVIREYHKDTSQNTDKLIEFLKDYPSMQSNIPEGVITTRPDLHTCKNEYVDELFGFFEECLEEYRYHYKLSLIHI